MIKKIKVGSLAIFVGLIVLQWASAKMVVTDPSSYSYYVKELKAAKERLEQLKESAKIATDTYSKVQDMADDVTGVYNRAQGIYEDLEKVRGMTSKPKRAFSDAKQIFNRGKDIAGALNDIDSNFDGIFVDISDPTVNPWMVQKKKHYEVQKIMSDALNNAELELAQMPARIDSIEELAKKIDQTANIKDSQDLTNRLIVELIVGQERMIVILSQLAQAEVASVYTGYDEEIAAEFKGRSILKADEKKSELDKLYQKHNTAEKYDKPAKELFGF